MNELLERDTLLEDPYVLRLMRAVLTQEEMRLGVRVLQVQYTARSTMRCDPTLLLTCCHDKRINPELLTLKDVAHLTSSNHLAVFFAVRETDMWSLASYASNLVPIKDRVDKPDKIH